MSKRIINIEGLIGAGKSTLIEELRLQSTTGNLGLKIGFIPEPLDIWSEYTNDQGQNILQLLYQDSKANSLRFQLVILKSLVDQFKQLDKSCDVVIVERSIES